MLSRQQRLSPFLAVLRSRHGRRAIARQGGAVDHDGERRDVVIVGLAHRSDDGIACFERDAVVAVRRRTQPGAATGRKLGMDEFAQRVRQEELCKV